MIATAEVTSSRCQRCQNGSGAFTSITCHMWRDPVVKNHPLMVQSLCMQHQVNDVQHPRMAHTLSDPRYPI
jgi:hypothetical protein